jgi:hypothetical protein
MFSNPCVAKRGSLCKLKYMNAVRVSSEPKLLAAAALLSGAANKTLLEDRRGPEPTPSYTIEEIHIRAETVTPLLKEILDFHPPVH